MVQLIYCDPTDFCGYHGCGKVMPAHLWRYRNGKPPSKQGETFYGGDVRICPGCGKAGTNKEIDEYNYWTIADPEQREIARTILKPKI